MVSIHVGPSSKPDSVTMYPFTGISHEDYVSFICEGNVGNPAGKFVWRKHLAGEHNPVVYSDPVTLSTKIQDSCSYHGTSNLTIQLTEDDNGATISCVEQSYQLETMMRKTSPLNIHCEYQIKLKGCSVSLEFTQLIVQTFQYGVRCT